MIDLKAPVSTDADRSPEAAALATRYRDVRAFSETLCRPLVTEDYVIQSMPDVSPTKWHLAHTTWFFETFVLKEHDPAYEPFHPAYAYLFNSYYVQAGERFYRPHRGLLSRPTVEEVYRYRAHVDRHVTALIEGAGPARLETIAPLVEIGLHHEQQHQELILTDLKHVFSMNPLYPVYAERRAVEDAAAPGDGMDWVVFEEGLYEIGHDGRGFAYDNEGPRHRRFLQAFALADRLVTNAEYLAFMEDGGYERPELWLSLGWATVEERGWKAPLYWERRDGTWYHYTLGGFRLVDPAEPVCHISYFEADAYARWAGARLPEEQEWEVAACGLPVEGNFVEQGHYHPVPAPAPGGLRQMYGDAWEWTRSAYSPYPGYTPPPGALGEYNGKFMCNQYVLRGGSCATSQTHIRPTYRNFFPPDARWQFSGIRLAKDV
ncbi:ergothioneine biosynthesis protein EgtB [Rhodocaloribacter litoris]|uniref:ergothioneine biosynthesis protein EgtB n=1 Tax=Rhodocaloribacter litoris TaxID=2558931 RepID=UPI001423427E|nr:ergothioneine biosynthesis protein EgtB [Rhodocaloribacter litoris]QXD14620.1 ergothioneine biosynthesis protein EgtB [Rhodocaloribacter litoris]